MLNIFGNGTILTWEPTPTKRGTWTILSTCIVTTSLCIWTAMHLNIPEKEEKRHGWQRIISIICRRHFWRKIGWVVLGLLAPEMVAFTAWSQRQNARMVLRKVSGFPSQEKSSRWHKKLFRGEENSQADPEQADLEQGDSKQAESWTMVHAFYAVMGGFLFDVTDSPEPFLPEKYRRMTLTVKGITDLAEKAPELIPNIPESRILDKSKANGIAKSLVCIQALWFCAQCISRLAQELPISLLELNTFGHSICALIIYVLWWEKPFEIAEGDVIDGDQVPEIFAWMWTRSYYAIRKFRSPEKYYFQKIEEEEPSTKDESESGSPGPDTIAAKPKHAAPQKVKRAMVSKPKRAMVFAVSADTNSIPSAAPAQPELHDIDEPNPSSAPPTSIRTGPNNKLHPSSRSGRESIVLRNGDELLSTGVEFHARGRLKRATLTPTDIKRWTLAARRHDTEDDERGSRRRVVPRSKNWPSFEIEEGFNQFWAVVMLAGIIYGGLHALAWNAVQFPTHNHRLLWRISSAVVMSGGFVEFCLFQIGRFFGDPPMVTVNLTFVAYALARAYLVVECFWSLFHSPAGIYDIPQWSSYLPHIS